MIWQKATFKCGKKNLIKTIFGVFLTTSPWLKATEDKPGTSVEMTPLFLDTVIVTRGLYTFYPIFEVQNVFSRGFFLKILALCI